jgi:mannose-1-phosphate guanylyltransferase
LNYAVILAGGRGERFWPLSRRSRPKQLLPIVGRRTMLEETVGRVSPLVRGDRVLVVATRLIKHEIRRLLPGVPDKNLLFEPLARNTALAVGFAAVHLAREHPKARMVVLPADHYIREKEKFLDAVRVALEVAQSKLLVTFGVVPDRAETQYGYIRLGKKIHRENGVEVFAARAFTEKPNRKRARSFLNSGEFLWNSGIFVWRVDAILEAIGEQMPQLHEGLMSYAASLGKVGEQAALNRLYKKSESISIDYGVMESAFNVAVVKADFRWDDVGSWGALTRLHEEDEHGNVVVGDHLSEDTRETIVFSESGLVATLGVSDLVIVRTGDVTLVARKGRSSDIRKLVDKLYENEDLKKYA